MCSGVRAEEAKGQPTAIDILWRSGDEASHVVTPEREAAESEGESTSQITHHTSIRGSGISAPVEGVTLRTSPGRTCPDDALARMITLYDLPKGFVVAQGIEVMLVESALTAMVETIVRCSLTKVALDGRDTLFQKSLNLLLVPADSLRIREVEHGILNRHATCGIHHMHTLRNDLREETVFRRKVRQLPQTGVEAVVRELFEHLHGILEAILGKLIVALPIDTKPTGIEVDHVAGDSV